MSPPIPVMCGSTTFSAAAAATAASIALPPASRMPIATPVANGWLVDAAPRGAYTVERPEAVAGLVTGPVTRASAESVQNHDFSGEQILEPFDVRELQLITPVNRDDGLGPASLARSSCFVYAHRVVAAAR